MSHSPESDVVAARTGDRDAFGRLVRRYRGLVSSISLSTLGNVATSEDVSQEVFLCAWRDLGSLQTPSSFLPWLRQLTRHRALDALRGGRRRDGGRLVGEDALEAAADPRPDAQAQLLEDESARAVALGLAALPSEAREVVTLYYRENRSIEQVASLLGVREGAAKKRLSRARDALREEVLARFADAVEATAPDDVFTGRVLLGLSPAAPALGAAAAKGLLSLLAKSAPLALAWAWIAGIIGGVAAVLWGLYRDLRGAIDARERKQLWVVAVLVIASVVGFELAVVNLPARTAETASRRLWLGTAYTIGYTAMILGASFLARPRITERRRQAELLVDPNAATRNACEDRRARLWGTLASGIVVAIVVAAWIRG